LRGEVMEVETYPLDTKISLEGRKPLIISAAGAATRESSIQKDTNTPMMNTLTNISKTRRRRRVPSAR